MVRLKAASTEQRCEAWDETSYEHVAIINEPAFTAEELAEEHIQDKLVNKEGLIIAWVDGVFYRAPKVEVR